MATKSLMLELQQFPVRGSNEFERAFSEMGQSRVDAVLVDEDAAFIANSEVIANLAARQRLPSIAEAPFAKAGGLLSFGANRVDLFRHGAIYVDKILKGANPAELPVEQPTKFELLINLKTAKLLGLILPPQLLARADEVIE